ncbi:MAG: hypothetical protein Q4G59_13345, partial [Planctomycetia bacterium]|nr:hypothetical protein [Planctomycetia bacterium]
CWVTEHILSKTFNKRIALPFQTCYEGKTLYQPLCLFAKAKTDIAQQKALALTPDCQSRNKLLTAPGILITILFSCPKSCIT